MSRPRDQGADQLSLDSGMALLLWPGPAPPATHTHRHTHARAHTHTHTRSRAHREPGGTGPRVRASLEPRRGQCVCSPAAVRPSLTGFRATAGPTCITCYSEAWQVWAGVRAVGIGEESCSDSSQFMARPFPCGEQSLFECDGGLGS